MRKTIIATMLIGALVIFSGCARLQLWTRSEKKVEQIEQLQVTTYEVKKGDSLWTIADSVYGNPNKWRIIYDANWDKLTSPDRLKPGMVLVIPKD